MSSRFSVATYMKGGDKLRKRRTDPPSLTSSSRNPHSQTNTEQTTLISATTPISSSVQPAIKKKKHTVLTISQGTFVVKWMTSKVAEGDKHIASESVRNFPGLFKHLRQSITWARCVYGEAVKLTSTQLNKYQRQVRSESFSGKEQKRAEQFDAL